uniref:Sulfatase N-terminal domain-containing protein n=1 Tax=Arcella intermedia TaxID=1963864 RepID=A0A6B2L401_9EUKA|eukprot:TRINITY_DN1012_c0_g1_i1.p1 TRINITY_DN1012_c0_g1~~TRINITY_DN1012_c0_g1_i1.p1  ORF type:complete len:440 (-),score=54.05 TRINITY_DN1012_c0_g1_i1:10-1329(-)
MSHANYIRAFPKTMAYLKSFYNKSGTFFELNGYTIVGDGTTQNLGGILFGHMESQLYEARNRMKGAKTVDDWPWVWHNASSQGYLTGYYEDEPDLGAFTLRLKGFKNNPTHYYMSPFWRNQRRKVTFSRSGQWDWERQLDFALDVFDTYPDLPIFSVAFTKVTHNDCLSFANKLDELVLERFKRIYESPYFDDTLIFLFGDHGPRYGVTRVTLQGKLEERLPGMIIKVPTWIAQDHPEMLENFRNNQNVLTTPFDIYHTLQHAISFPQAPPPSTFRSSLFEFISPNRTCAQASVGEHWCTCTSRSPAPINDIVKDGAKQLVDRINKKIDLHGEDLCLPVELKQIMTAEVSLYSDELLSFSGSGDADGRRPKFGAVNKTQTYQIQFEVAPGGGIFEGDFRATHTKLGVNLEVGENFSRLNAYGQLPCNPKPIVREYCVCK